MKQVLEPLPRDNLKAVLRGLIAVAKDEIDKSEAERLKRTSPKRRR